VYKLLQSGCERDVAEWNDLRRPAPADPVVFKVKPHGHSFFVSREGHQINASIEFMRTDAGISVRRDDGTFVLEATLALNDDGKCRLKVGKEELSFWQFRKRAMEDLFFKF